MLGKMTDNIYLDDENFIWASGDLLSKVICLTQKEVANATVSPRKTEM